jgi:S-DNA-T family DNA segregation ATPase FtsK/SpoIIIE
VYAGYFEAQRNGPRAGMRTLPGVGVDQVTKMSGHLANTWGCVRVDVAQHSPGMLFLSGYLTDPLASAWHLTPDSQALKNWRLHVGVDDQAEQEHLPLTNLSGMTIAGVPGTGETSLQRWWLCQLAPHLTVQIGVLDRHLSLHRCWDGCWDEA